MDHYGIWSLVPPVLAIIIAIWTRQVYVSLFLGIWAGWLIIDKGNILRGSMDTVQAFVDVFKDAGNTRTIMFGALVGALIIFVQRSGGVQGFTDYISNLVKDYEKEGKGGPKRFLSILAWLAGVVVFVESSISVLTIGALFRPLFDKFKISREKLAYLADSSSAPTCILIPLNAWGAFIMGLLAAQGLERPFQFMISTIPYNLYPILALVLAFVVAFTGWNIGQMKQAERRVKETGALLNEGAQPVISQDVSEVKMKEGLKPRMINMLLPIATMVLMMPVMLAYTGWGSTENFNELGNGSKIITAIGGGSGSTSVLIAVLSAIAMGIVLYSFQRMFSLAETVELMFKGISGLMPLALLMLFAFALSALCKELGTGIFVAETAKTWLSPSLVPFLIFIVSAFIAFSTGTSWGTFAIMIPIAVPMAQSMDASLMLSVAAALGGGVFGDHSSPISDTTILSSMAAATDHIDHVRTQLPYAMLAGTITALIYLVLGFLG